MTDASYDLSCACGAVRLHIAEEPAGPFQCYCRQCRHASGGGPATFVMASRDAVQMEGSIASYSEPTQSGNTASRSFCPACGTAVYSEPGSVPDLLAIKLSMFDETPWLKVQAAFWTCEAPAWHGPDPAIPTRPKD